MKISVLFVCLGNICRSPLAMSLFKQKIKERDLEENFIIDSCGTSDYHIGDKPDHRTAENASKNGLNVNHQARQFEREDFRKFDYILTMDRSNLANVKKLDPSGKFNDKLHLMREFDPEEKDAEVPDPYFGGDEGFQNVYNILDRSTEEFLDFILEEQEKNNSTA